jgi:hypothetical protein
MRRLTNIFVAAANAVRIYTIGTVDALNDARSPQLRSLTDSLQPHSRKHGAFDARPNCRRSLPASLRRSRLGTMSGVTAGMERVWPIGRFALAWAKTR